MRIMPHRVTQLPLLSLLALRSVWSVVPPNGAGAILGPANTTARVAACPYSCSGHGRCTGSGQCLCDRGFTGDACSLVEAACPNNCAGHGRCDGERCVCDPGFGGRDCGRALRRACPGNCAGHGTCLSSGKCACNPGFDGPECDRMVVSPGCAHNCSGRGFCAGGFCVCAAGLSGAACEVIRTDDASGTPSPLDLETAIILLLLPRI